MKKAWTLLISFIAGFSTLSEKVLAIDLGLVSPYNKNRFLQPKDVSELNFTDSYVTQNPWGLDMQRVWTFKPHANIAAGYGADSWKDYFKNQSGAQGPGLKKFSLKMTIPWTDKGFDLSRARVDIDVVFVAPLPKNILPHVANCFTVAEVIFCKETISNELLAHEMNHVGQWDLLGPIFLPLYVLDKGMLEDYVENGYMLAPCGQTCEIDPLIRIENGKVSIKPYFTQMLKALIAMAKGH